MPTAFGFAAHGPKEPVQKIFFERRELGDKDIFIDIKYCGICHSDVSMADSEWSTQIKYPIVPGHEIVGQVRSVGKNVRKAKPGDFAAVGCFVDSCRHCRECKNDSEQYCKGRVLTYDNPVNTVEGYTKGGFSNFIIVDEDFVMLIPKALQHKLPNVAPLMCAGITTYSCMMYNKMNKPGSRIGVLGLGGLGHMAVKFALAFNNSVTVISTSISKKEKALKELGASTFIHSQNADELSKAAQSLDFIIDTTPVVREIHKYLPLLSTNGVYVIVGLPPIGTNIQCDPKMLVYNRIAVTGSLLGSIRQHQEMLEFCAEKNIFSDIKIITSKDIDHAFESLRQNQADSYRYVIDLQNS